MTRVSGSSTGCTSENVILSAVAAGQLFAIQPGMPARSLIASVVLGTSLLVGCLPPPKVEIRRSALVPAATPMQRSGQTMGRNLLEASATGHSNPSQPQAGNNDTGVAVPQAQGRGEFRFRHPRLESLDFGIGYLHIPSRGAQSVVDYPVPEEDGAGYTATVFGSVGDTLRGNGLRLGFGVELAAYSLPFLVYERCISNCGGKPWTTLGEYREVIPGIGFALIPNYRYGPITISAHLNAKTHPDIDRIDIVDSYVRIPEGPDSGSLVFIVGAGIEADLPYGLRLGATAHTVPTGPVSYGPQFAATLTIPLVRQATP